MFEIKFKRKIYVIKRELLIKILSKLSINFDNDIKDGKIYSLLRKHKLLDEIFLKNVCENIKI